MCDVKRGGGDGVSELSSSNFPMLGKRDIKLMVGYLCVGQDYSLGSMGRYTEL